MSDSLAQFGIAITRPIAQAQKLNALILEAGGTPISFPLIDIVPLQDYTEFDLTLQAINRCDWAIFISSNAVQNGLPRLIEAQTPLPAALKFAAIGPVTAQEIHKAGIADVLTPVTRFDSEALLALPEMQAVSDQRIMIFRGVGGREILADTLKARGAAVIFAECYRRINPQVNSQLLETLWQNKQCQAIVVTSSEAMRHLLAMTDDGQAPWLQEMAICVNHARIAEEARACAHASVAAKLNITVAAAPGDAAMLSCIKRALLKPLP